MGVRGLTTFIKTQEKKYLKNHKLHNCTIILDGNSVASNLFIWCNTESAFGGDYDKFAKYVKEFFKVLRTCKIEPLVVFDGGYEERKLKTVYSRIIDKFKLSQSAQPLTGSLNFPLFMRMVFREVLTELNIPIAQSDFEADEEIAALARQLKCPVLSYDSDFYIYDVLYIPFPSVCLEPVLLEKKNSIGGSCEQSYYLSCKIYNVDVFIESFGGLDKSMLPLLATLLGNDYVKRSLFTAFYANLKIPKGKSNPLQRRIKAVIEWLRNETFESAVEKILSRMKKRKRSRVLRQMNKIVTDYIKCSSVLSQHLKITCNNKSIDEEKIYSYNKANIDSIIERINENIESFSDIEDDSLGVESSSEAVSEDSEDECPVEENIIESNTKLNYNENAGLDCNVLPDWLLEYSRKGKIQSCVIDIVSLKQYFFIPQVEDFSLPSAHFISLKILNAIVGLLCGKSDNPVKYWTRDGSHLNCYCVEPIIETPSSKFPQINEMLQIHESIRKSILLEVVEATVDLNQLPDEWHLFIVATIFWLKNMKQPVATECHLSTIIMSLICIYTFDLHLGVHRNKQTFLKKYKNYLNKVIESRSREKEAMEESNTLLSSGNLSTKHQTSNPKTELGNVTREDCVMMFQSILPYHHLSEQIKSKPKTFNLSIVHAFSQFQSCLYHIMVLNSVMGFPFKEPIISRLFSGTFAYNVYTNLSIQNDVDIYLATLFENCPSLLGLYKVLVNFLQSALCDTDLYKKPLKRQRKRKKCKKQFNTEEIFTNDTEENDTLYKDENNRFSALSFRT